jgi:hypothetical protein
MACFVSAEGLVRSPDKEFCLRNLGELFSIVVVIASSAMEVEVEGGVDGYLHSQQRRESRSPRDR